MQARKVLALLTGLSIVLLVAAFVFLEAEPGKYYLIKQEGPKKNTLVRCPTDLGTQCKVAEIVPKKNSSMR